MSARRTTFLVFGDQSTDSYAFLSDFCRRSNLGLLSKSFLEQVYHAVKVEINALPAISRQGLPQFSSIEQLNRRYHESSVRFPSLDSALLCIAQIAHYIDTAEKVQNEITSPAETTLIGVCTGLFAATAVGMASSLSSLIPIAVEAVLSAHRVGFLVGSIAEHLFRKSDKTESWTVVVPATDRSSLQNILDHFNSQQHLPKPKQAYISALSSTHVSVSGPPSTLHPLSLTSGFESESLPLPIYGPYHAQHLFGSCDLNEALQLNELSQSATLYETRTQLPVITSTGNLIHTGNSMKSTIISAVKEILNEPLHFDALVAACVSMINEFPRSEVLITPIGPGTIAKQLVTALKSQTDNQITLQYASSIAKDRLAKSNSSKRCKLAIVGMAGRFPDAATHEKLWDLLERGLAVHREVPKDRFDVSSHVDPSGKTTNTSHTPYGCWIENPGLFDPRFFNMSPREAFQTDPMQRMALSTAYEALEMSGYQPNRTPSTRLDRIGTFYGQTSDDWREINAAQEVDTYFITGGVRAFGPGRINYHFGFSGPSFSVDTACSSSMAAMQLACTSLWAGDCDTAIVGGMSCMTNSDIFAGLSRGQFLSKNGPCATFDDEADGYCRADAVGTIIVKRLEDAEADGDNVLAVILATATNHSADAISITHPHGGTQELLYRHILDQAGVEPLDIDYVEMHGTGTQAGDGTEMKSVTNVFAPAKVKRTSLQPLYLGSVKANVGHGEAASGITAIIKCLMMLKKDTIPPHVGIKGTMNRKFPTDLSQRNVNIAFHKTPLVGRPGQPRRIYISNFSAAGGNSGLLIEDGPRIQNFAIDVRSQHVVTVSGKSKSSMIRNAERLIEYIEQNSKVSLPSLAYTTTARRIHHPWRMTVTASDVDQVKVGLQSKLTDSLIPAPPESPKVAFLFTGQGSPYFGMGRLLHETSSIYHQAISELNGLALLHGFPSFLPLIDGSEPDLSRLSPIVVQLGLVCLEIALAKLWASWGVTPSVVIGHSLGEYVALHVSGVLSASDTIYLVGTRAQLLVECCTPKTHTMLAVKGSIDAVKEAVKDYEADLNVACINGPRETVLSGLASDIHGVSSCLGQAGFKCTILNVPFAFHSAQVESVLGKFEKTAKAVQFNSPKIPFISTLLARVLDETEAIDSFYLRRHCREPVDFMGGLVAAQKSGVIDERTIWLECGPHPVCLNFVKATFGVATITTPTLRQHEDPYHTLASSLSVLHVAGLTIDWNEHHRDFRQAHYLLDLPSYSFDDKNYWIQYEGDWCLTKGRISQASSRTNTEKPAPKLSTTTVQKIAHESVNGTIATVRVESDISQSELDAAVAGHLVNGTALCPSSIYADMALTTCEYTYKLMRPNEEQIGMNVAGMEVMKPLIARRDGKSQILKLEVIADLVIGHAKLVFSSGEGKTHVEHAKCKVFFGENADHLAEFQRNSYLIKSRIDWLKNEEINGNASKIGRGLAYKLFSALVDYDSKYRGMEEVILDSTNLEATSIIKFQTCEADGKFNWSPYWIDSLAHISGFIVNGSDAIDSKAQVFISHGWESMRFSKALDAGKTYRSYVKMQPVNDKVFAGDVYVFDEDRIIGLVGGLKFQCIPRALLNTFLPPIAAASKRQHMPQPERMGAKPRTILRKKTTKTARINSVNLETVNSKLTSICERAMEILAKEIGVDLDELVENVAIADLGVDSLMSLTVSGRLREELEIDVHSSIFNECINIGQLKTHLAQFDRRENFECSSNESEIRISIETTPDLDDFSPISTPEDDNSSQHSKDESLTTNLSSIIRSTIAEEMGFEVEEILDTHDLGSLGLDSLMSLSILGTLRERTGMSLPSDLLVANTSIAAIEKSLDIAKETKPNITRNLRAIEVTSIQSIPLSSSATPERLASSVLLQGNPRTATKFLWMVPDGSGSATSYTDIPDISPKLAVWGLFSPFMKTPEEYKCGVIGIAAKFVTEIKRRQPQGPYLLAGWSAGGVIAFEAVNQLLKNDDLVENLIIIDAPCPLVIEPLPASLHRWFASIGLLGDGDDLKAKKIPSWLLPHFAASVNALSNYNAEQIDPERCPNVTAIWCEDGVCKLPSDPRPDPFPYGHAQFLLDNRTDFGPNLWDVYLSKEKITTRQIPDCNHFSMMKGIPAKILGSLIREAII